MPLRFDSKVGGDSAEESEVSASSSFSQRRPSPIDILLDRGGGGGTHTFKISDPSVVVNDGKELMILPSPISDQSEIVTEAKFGVTYSDTLLDGNEIATTKKKQKKQKKSARIVWNDGDDDIGPAPNSLQVTPSTPSNIISKAQMSFSDFNRNDPNNNFELYPCDAAAEDQKVLKGDGPTLENSTLSEFDVLELGISPRILTSPQTSTKSSIGLSKSTEQPKMESQFRRCERARRHGEVVVDVCKGLEMYQPKRIIIDIVQMMAILLVVMIISFATFPLASTAYHGNVWRVMWPFIWLRVSAAFAAMSSYASLIGEMEFGISGGYPYSTYAILVVVPMLVTLTLVWALRESTGTLCWFLSHFLGDVMLIICMVLCHRQFLLTTKRLSSPIIKFVNGFSGILLCSYLYVFIVLLFRAHSSDPNYTSRRLTGIALSLAMPAIKIGARRVADLHSLWGGGDALSPPPAGGSLLGGPLVEIACTLLHASFQLVVLALHADMVEIIIILACDTFSALYSTNVLHTNAKLGAIMDDQYGEEKEFPTKSISELESVQGLESVSIAIHALASCCNSFVGALCSAFILAIENSSSIMIGNSSNPTIKLFVFFGFYVIQWTGIMYWAKLKTNCDILGVLSVLFAYYTNFIQSFICLSNIIAFSICLLWTSLPF